MNPGGRLTIRLGSETTQSGATEARIDFEDQGMGIPREILEKIFEPGFTTRAGSPGLGLAVCQKVVEEHQGRLGVRSAPPAGTTFTLTFPLSGGPA
jgi:signal transduction histidine kinase